MILALLIALQEDPSFEDELRVVREIEEGHRLYHLGEYEKAEAVFRKHAGTPETDAALGRTLLKLGREEEARVYLGRAIEKGDRPHALREIGRDALEERDPKLAADALRRVSEIEDDADSYAALGRTLLALRDGKGARAALEKARGVPDLEALLQEADAYRAAQDGDFDAIEKLRDAADPAIRDLARHLERRMELAYDDTRIRLRTNPVYDSNAILLPDEPVAVGEIPRDSSFGWAGELDVEQRLFAFSGTDVLARFDGRERIYFDGDVPDVSDLLGSIEWRPGVEAVPPPIPDDWDWSLRYQIRGSFVDYDAFLFSHEASASIVRAWNATHRTSLTYGVGFDDFRDDPARDFDDRDGVTHQIQLGHSISFPEANGLVVRGAVYGLFEFRDGSNYEARSPGFRLGASGDLVWEIRWDAGFHVRFENYVHPNTRLDLADERDDDLFEFSVGLSRDIASRFTAWFRYSFTDRRSNIDEFEYDRSFLEFGVDWRL